MNVTGALRRTVDVALDATPGSVPRARKTVCAIATANGACAEDLERIALAVSEAVTNAIVHAYGDAAAGSVELTAAAVDGELSVLVRDDGCGLGAAAASPGLGLGMGVMEYSADVLTITTRASGGTLVEMRFALNDYAQAPDSRPRAGAQLRASAASAAMPA